jgi:transcriptional regulator with XRE-family HTH domain
MTWGEQIKAARKAKKISLVDLAKTIGISEVYMSQIEASKFKPATYKVLHICAVLELNPWNIAVAMGREIDMIQVLCEENGSIESEIYRIGEGDCTLEFAQRMSANINNGGTE